MRWGGACTHVVVVGMRAEREKTTKLKYETFFFFFSLSFFFTHTHTHSLECRHDVGDYSALVHYIKICCFNVKWNREEEKELKKKKKKRKKEVENNIKHCPISSLIKTRSRYFIERTKNKNKSFINFIFLRI